MSVNNPVESLASYWTFLTCCATGKTTKSVLVSKPEYKVKMSKKDRKTAAYL